MKFTNITETDAKNKISDIRAEIDAIKKDLIKACDNIDDLRFSVKLLKHVIKEQEKALK